MDEFFDAKSLLGSLQSTFSSFMAGSEHSAGGGAHDMALSHMHDLAASVREVGRAWARCSVERPTQAARALAANMQVAESSGTDWEAHMDLPSLAFAVVLTSAAADSAAAPVFTPRLCVECMDVALHAQVRKAAAPGSIPMLLTTPLCRHARSASTTS